MIVVLLLACVLLAILKFRGNRNSEPVHLRDGLQSVRRIVAGKSGRVQARFQLDFVPAAPKKIPDCEELFGPDTAASAFQMSPEFQAGFTAFLAAVNKSTFPGGYEGHSGQDQTQSKVLHYLASRSNVSTICETGFNLGHSAFSYLTANPHAVVHSFDIGQHAYAHKMATYMLSRFPDRLFVHFGNSMLTVPAFARENPNYHCDFMFVDGGHSYPVAMADLLNFAAMANLDDGNIIMFDDYPVSTSYSRDIAPAWENMCRWGYVRELLRCSYAKFKFLRGFVIGTVLQRPRPQV